MTELVENAINEVLVLMQAKYKNWFSLDTAERRLLVMAYLADVLKVREVGGNNRGKWIKIFLASVGLEEGYPWCAAAVNFASMVADAPRPLRPEYNPAAVIGWRRYAEALGMLVSSPKRGSICMHQTSASQGHIAVVVKTVGLWVYSIEGNTGPGEGGSQRDGDGFYRRVRLKSFWSWGFSNLGTTGKAGN